MVIFQKVFTSADRNPNVNGDARLITVTESMNGVRIVISGVQGQGLNTRPVELSNVEVSQDQWDAFKDVIIASAR